MIMPDPQSDWDKVWGQLIAKAWADDNFKKRLIADPGAVLKEHGINVPAGMQVKVVENSSQVVHVALPPKPPAEELSDEELSKAAGGDHGCRGCHYSENRPPCNYCGDGEGRRCCEWENGYCR
jgi:hypothetical protein